MRCSGPIAATVCGRAQVMIDDSALALIGMVLFLSAADLSLAPDAPKPLAVANWLALAALSVLRRVWSLMRKVP